MSKLDCPRRAKLDVSTADRRRRLHHVPFVAGCELALLSTGAFGDGRSAEELFDGAAVWPPVSTWRSRASAERSRRRRPVNGLVEVAADRRDRETIERGAHRGGGTPGRGDDLRGLPAGGQRVPAGRRRTAEHPEKRRPGRFLRRGAARCRPGRAPRQRGHQGVRPGRRHRCRDRQRQHHGGGRRERAGRDRQRLDRGGHRARRLGR